MKKPKTTEKPMPVEAPSANPVWDPKRSDLGWPLIFMTPLPDSRTLLKDTDGYIHECPLYITGAYGLMARTRNGFLSIFNDSNRLYTSSPNMRVLFLSGILPYCEIFEQEAKKANMPVTNNQFSILRISRAKDSLDVSIS